jgi:FKBP-type peptidyl-prolyl cis-trans isomerase
MCSSLALFLVIAGSVFCSAPGFNLNNAKVPTSEKAELKNELLGFFKLSTAAVFTSAVFPSIASAYGAIDEKSKKKKLTIQETDDGVKYIMQKKGEGPYPNPGDFVAIDYDAFLKNGTMFDSTIGKGKKSISFRIGQKQVIPGIESVLNYMQPGGELTCTIPAALAYGSKGVCIKDGCIVPPGEDLKYYIKLKSVGAGYN